MNGTVKSDRPTGQVISVQLDGDPFPVWVEMAKVEKGKMQMPTTTAGPSRKEMRKRAATLGIEGWETLSTDALSKAIRKAEKSTNGKVTKPKAKVAKPKKVARGQTKADKAHAKKRQATGNRPAAKAATGKAKAASKPAPKSKKSSTTVAREPAENGNPFRKGTNLFLITEELIKGGRRMSIITKLQRRIDLHPWAKKKPDLDLDFEMDKRILLCTHLLKKQHDFTVTLTGRGPAEGTIKVFPPGAKKAKPKSKTAKVLKKKIKRKAA